jgi:hypothetical protein
VIGGVRAVAFANLGASQYAHNDMQVFANNPVNVQPIIGYSQNPFTGEVAPILGPMTTIKGTRLQDGRASYGIGLETFALGFPIHFDWAWRTLLNKPWEDYVYAYNAVVDGEASGSRWLRKPKFSIWIGYDF